MDSYINLLVSGSLDAVQTFIDGHVGRQSKDLDTSLVQGERSFFAEAILNGRNDIVEFMAERFPSEVSNCLRTNPADMEESPFHVACKLYDAKLVQLLIKHGASVHRPDKYGLLPVHAAACNASIEVLDVLLSNGADIDQQDCYGWTPLCSAFGKTELMASLLQRGASVNVRLASGLTPIHLAAAQGAQQLEALFVGGVPVTSVFPPSEARDDYAPCPLYMVAANCHDLLVNVLVEHPDCPLECKADARLLLNIASRFKMRETDSMSASPDTDAATFVSEVDIGPEFVDAWKAVLNFREEHGLSVPRLVPIEAYGHRTEVATAQELEALKDNPEELIFQAVMVYERCFGYRRHNRELACLLCCAASHLLHLRRFNEAERVVERALGLSEPLLLPHPSNLFICRNTYVSFKVPVFINWLYGLCFTMKLEGHAPRYAVYVSALLDLVDMCANVVCSNSEPRLVSALCKVLILLYHWKSNLLRQERDTFTQLGERFVTKYLHPLKGSTLLHILFMPELMKELTKRPNTSVALFTAFVCQMLEWGACDVINESNSSGERPLHYLHRNVVLFGNALTWSELVFPLVEYGAHLDAVDRKGLVVFSGSAMASLSCLVCKAVVREKLPYRQLDIPKFLKDFIALHDPGAA